MKSFAFRLDRILQWRITSLKTEEARLEQIRLTLEFARMEREKLATALSLAKQSTGNHALLRGADLHALDSYAARLAKEITLMNHKMSVIVEAIAKQVLVVSDCDRNVRLMERLRDRRRAEWKAEISRESEALSSDFSGSQWLRMRRESELLAEPD